ncbi:MAG: hypothetical protein LBJ00_08415 [Planctomycetaceae bacterium]|nr:hypothetical protein [Planctomycetaceae bacterium]
MQIYSSCLKFLKLDTQAQQREAVVQGRSLSPYRLRYNADSLKIIADQILLSDLANISPKSASFTCRFKTRNGCFVAKPIAQHWFRYFQQTILSGSKKLS